jgi:hypothetical protein
VEVIAFDLDVARHHASLLGHVRRAGEPGALTTCRSRRPPAPQAGF